MKAFFIILFVMMDYKLQRYFILQARLRYELQTNKPMTPISDGREDEVVWNEYLTKRKNMESDGNGQLPRWQVVNVHHQEKSIAYDECIMKYCRTYGLSYQNQV